MSAEPEVLETGQLRSTLGPVVVLISILAAGAASWLALREGPDAAGVVVVTRGCSVACSENVSRRVAFLLERHGLSAQVVASGELAEMSRASLHTLQVEIHHVPVSPLVRGAAALTVHVTMQTQTRGEPAREEVDLELIHEAPSLDRALLDAGLAAVDALVPGAIAEIIASDAITTYLRTAPSAHDLQRFDELEAARVGVATREQSIGRFEELCAESGREIATPEATSLQVHCLTPACGNEYLVGVALDGSGALLRVETAHPIFILGSATDVRRAEVPERFVWANVDGTRREVLATANLYSSASMDASARYVAYVEIAGDGSAVLVRLDMRDGSRKLVHAVEAPARLLFPEISPDGRYIAVSYRAHANGDERIYVVDANGGTVWEAAAFALQAKWVELSLGQGPAELLLAITIAGEQTTLDAMAGDGDTRIDEAEVDEDLLEPSRSGPSGELPPLTHVALVRPGEERGEVVRRIGGVQRHVGTVAGMHEGTLVLTSSSPEHGCSLALWDGELHFLATEQCITYPTLGPDGAVYADALMSGEEDPQQGESEIVRVDVSTGAIEVLTANAVRDRWVRSRATSRAIRMFFERIGERKYARHPVASVCWADVQPAGVSVVSLDIEADGSGDLRRSNRIVGSQ